MHQGLLARRHWRVALALCGLLTASSLRAQEVTPHAMKAAFLLNFVRFSEWPSDATPAGDWTLCVSGDSALEEALAHIVKGQTVAGRALEVRAVSTAGDATGCAVLYVGASARPLAQQLHDLPVLTVSDTPSFSATDGIIELTVEGGHMGFSVNVDAASRSRLRLSSQLLRLARIVSPRSHP